MRELSILEKFKIGAEAGWEVTEDLFKGKVTPLDAPGELRNNLKESSVKKDKNKKLKGSD